MSSPTRPMTDHARSLAGLPPVLAAELAHDEEAAAIECSRVNPPQQVLQQMAQADLIGQMLRESGREITFSLSEQNQLLGIELCDVDGNLIKVMSAAETTEIAVGKPVE